MKTISVAGDGATSRLDKYVLKLLDNAGKGFVYKMLRKKNIVLNGSKASGSEILKAGDIITLYLSDETIASMSSPIRLSHDAGGLSIVYEDDFIIIADKPAGVLSQPESAADSDTMNDRLISYLVKSGALETQAFSAFKPSVCHRLDRNTSGLIICAKTLAAASAIARMHKDGGAKKHYTTIVKGELCEALTLEGYHGKDNASNVAVVTEHYRPGTDKVLTECQPVKSNGRFTLVDAAIISGKSHQIRAHLQSAGYPVAGDVKYGDKPVNDYLKRSFGLKNQLLHAERIEFLNVTEPLDYLNGQTFVCRLPKIFTNVAKGVGLL